MTLKKTLSQISLTLTTAGLSLMSPVSVLAAPQAPTPDGGLGGGTATINPGTGFAQNIGDFLNAILSFVMVIAALLVFFYLIWGGIEWITSGGDKGKTESARNKITAAVIGIIVLAAAYAILQVVLNFLGFGSVNDIFKTGVDITGGGLEIK